MTFTQAQDDQYDRAVEASRATAKRLGYDHAPSGMLVAHMAAQRSTRPTTADTANPFWPAAFEPYRGTWSETDDELWERDNERMITMIAVERRHREAKAAADKARTDEGAAADKQRRDEEYAAAEADLKRRYLSLGGVTEADFARDLPDLLSAERMRRLDQQNSADDVARRAQRARTQL